MQNRAARALQQPPLLGYSGRMTEPRTTFSTFLAELNHTYERLHTAKEDAFWAAYTGLHDDADAARRELQAREIDLQRWLQDPSRLRRVRQMLEQAEIAHLREGAFHHPTEDDLVALRGWVRTLEANVIEYPEAREASTAVIDLEGKLARARQSMRLGYEVDGSFHEASSVELATMLRTDPDESRRHAAWEGLRSIEPVVLEGGFIDLVKQRNALARMLGAEDYYDWRVQRVEGMRKSEIFALLDELEGATRTTAQQAIEGLRGQDTAVEVAPWNINYLISGDVIAEQDPYFPFSKAFERWGRSFAALGINYRDAQLVLDLVDRKGKYENGFMHGPVPAWREEGTFHPARIHFTANAIPGMLGSGLRATQTLFHEGGHAAHFANIDMPAPCFAQEFAPTSVAFAETQSMFLDSLLRDADWQTRYARREDGETMPFALIERGIRARQPFAAWSIRAMLMVPYAERAIYELPEAELTPERILETIREVEKKLLFVESPRPVLSVPHLLAGESSAYYHGYVLAEMAVEQTRQFFLGRDGHLVDNPRIGHDLRQFYWLPGNSLSFLDLVEGLTGKPLTSRHLAERANKTADAAVEEARAQVDTLADVAEFDGEVALHADIRIVDGHEVIASTATDGFAGAAKRFESWINDKARARRAAESK